MIPPEIWVIIGVCLGTILGFMLNLLKDFFGERQQKKKYLGDLLADLEYNKKLAEEGKHWGYHTLGYVDAKGAKYLFDLPPELRNKIYDAQTITSYLYETRSTGNRAGQIGELRKILEDIIPKLKKYLSSSW